MRTTREHLRTELDRRGWKSPWHEHWRMVRKDGPPRIENCGHRECEAPGCPRTASGFPEVKA